VLLLTQNNVPIGAVDIPRPVVNELPRCHCKPDADDGSACGPDSDCINRCMYYECHPAVCPAGEHCLNRRLQRRQYPATKPFRTDRRGWGLLASVDIAKVCSVVVSQSQPTTKNTVVIGVGCDENLVNKFAFSALKLLV